MIRPAFPLSDLTFPRLCAIVTDTQARPSMQRVAWLVLKSQRGQHVHQHRLPPLAAEDAA